jgi:hypothetical protein
MKALRHHKSSRPTTVCAWCNGVIRPGAAKISHGICVPCRAQWFGKLRRTAALVAVPLPKTA